MLNSMLNNVYGMVLIIFLAQLANQGLMNIVSLGLAVPIITIAINNKNITPITRRDINFLFKITPPRLRIRA